MATLTTFDVIAYGYVDPNVFIKSWWPGPQARVQSLVIEALSSSLNYLLDEQRILPGLSYELGPVNVCRTR